MSEKRKDNHRRILRDGEGQRPDGRYSYTYQGLDGRRHTVYSWRLEKGDRVPAGKRDRGASLREREKEILRDLADGIDTNGGNQILNDAIKAYLDSKHKLRESTLCHYRYFAEHFIRDSIGQKRLSAIKRSTILSFYNNLYVEKDVSLSTIATLNQILHPVFVRAVQDGCLRLVPTAGIMREFKEKNEAAAGKRFALTKIEQEMFFGYLDADESGRFDFIRPFLSVLKETGMRIGEAACLQWADIDFAAETIRIEKSLAYHPGEDGKSRFYVNEPKTAAGQRMIPLSPKARQEILAARKLQMQLGLRSPQIDGYSNFVFLNSRSLPFTQCTVNGFIDRITQECNDTETEQAALEHREPHLIREFSAHILRHTYATRAIENGVHPKALQRLLGHEHLDVTMNTYSESQDDFTMTEAKKMWKVS